MEFKYTAKIIQVLPNSLMVEFSRFGGSVHIVGTPHIPEAGDPAKFLRQYAPIHTWMEELTPRISSVVGQEFVDIVIINNNPEPVPTTTFPTLVLTADVL